MNLLGHVRQFSMTNVSARALRKRVMPNFLRRIKGAYKISSTSHFSLLEWMIQYFDAMGAKRSYEQNRPLTMEGRFLPWMTYPAIEFLKQLDLADKFVFEYGSGNGSIFWAERARRVVSVENDIAWASELQSLKRENQEIILASSRAEYINAIKALSETPDIVIIDGLFRSACAETAIKIISSCGMIVLDNSDWHPVTCQKLTDAGFHQFDFIGPGPINPYAWATSIFINRDSPVKIARLNIAPFVIGGITDNGDER